MLENVTGILQMIQGVTVGINYIGNGELNTDELGFALNGSIAIKRENGTFVSYNPETKRISIQEAIISDPKYFVITPVDTLRKGDLIKIGYDYIQIIDDSNGLSMVNLTNGVVSIMIPEEGQVLYNKITCVLSNLPQDKISSLFLQKSLKEGSNNELLNVLLQSEILGKNISDATSKVATTISKELASVMQPTTYDDVAPKIETSSLTENITINNEVVE